MLGKANLNVAGRWTNYSTSGNVHTWKIGATWDTPLEWLRLRAVGSRDVRAPNLSELFAAPISTHLPNFNDPFNGTSVSVSQNAVGNPNLKPEIAHNLELGFVLTRLPHLSGFNFSLDYYQIDIANAISTLAAQDQVNYCHAGVTQLCGSFYLNDPTGAANYVNVEPFNLASIFTDGFDIEASDQWTEPYGLPGHLTVRALATRVENYITNTGLPGAVSIQQAGANTGSTPYWKLFAQQSWDVSQYSFTLQERFVSDGVFGHQYVVCSAGNCPVSTNNHPTIDDNTMPGAFYLDVSASYNIGHKLTAYAKIDNVFDADPTPSPQTNTGLDANPALYDLLGRMYHVGIRYNF
jgi:outer membrane receptor protein involved in Fe transport